MNLLAVIMIFIGLNIDTFIALLFVLRNYNYRLPIITFVTATITLWILGVVLGKGLAALFPDWITGFMGIVLIFLAVFGQNDDDNKNINTFNALLSVLNIFKLRISRNKTLICFA